MAAGARNDSLTIYGLIVRSRLLGGANDSYVMLAAATLYANFNGLTAAA